MFYLSIYLFFQKCKDCKGRGWETCDDCDGWGRVECEACDGEGHRTVTDLEGNEIQIDCMLCSGGMRT